MSWNDLFVNMDNTNFFNFSFLPKYGSAFVRGFEYTLLLAVVSVLLAVIPALLLALMLLALAGCGKKEDHPQPEDPNVTQEEKAVPVHLVCSNGSITLRFSLEEGHWLWADDKTFPLDESYALALLETVQGIESLPPVTTAAQLADYGLDSPTKYVTVTDSQGNVHPLTDATLVPLLTSPDRELRRVDF